MPTWRICLTIKSFFNQWSAPLFSWPSCLIQVWYGREKLDACHSWDKRVKLESSMVIIGHLCAGSHKQCNTSSKACPLPAWEWFKCAVGSWGFWWENKCQNPHWPLTSSNLAGFVAPAIVLDPLQPNISRNILHTVLNTFPRMLTRRVCLTI